MSSLNTLYIKLDVLKTLVSTLEKKNQNGIELTVSLNDEPNTYGQNVSGWVSQSKEDREAKKDRYFIGNGKTVWTQGETPVPPRTNQPHSSAAPADDFPF